MLYIKKVTGAGLDVFASACIMLFPAEKTSVPTISQKIIPYSVFIFAGFRLFLQRQIKTYNK